MPAERTAEQMQAEFPEQVMRGPFGGIQSELPLDSIEKLGFRDCVNIISRKGVMGTAPGYVSLLGGNNTEANPVLGAYDFFDAGGARHQVVFYQDVLFSWDGPSQTWTQLTTAIGPTGRASNYFAFEDVNYLMCYTQGSIRYRHGAVAELPSRLRVRLRRCILWSLLATSLLAT